MFDSLKLYVEENIDIEQVFKTLDNYGYLRTKNVSSEGDYSLKGDTLIIYPATFEYPVRIDLDDTKILSIKSVELLSFRTIDSHSAVIILPIGTLRRTKIKKDPILMGEKPINSFIDIEPGDFVVHVDYGIGKYHGIVKMREGAKLKERIFIEYKGGDKLYVAIEDIHKIQRYVAFHRKPPELNSLKGTAWENTKKRAVNSIAKIAEDLLELQAKRESTKAFAFSKDTEWQKEMEKKFPFKETPDQLKAVIDVKHDLEKARPMDRLLCGDVGYGKTEVALRAAFKVMMDNKQVALLVPTTILAEQHADTFQKRLKDYPLKIKMLNRFCSSQEEREVTKGLKTGAVDMVIGTHRLLSKDIIFKDLGLLIIDEEQRFGVRQKETIKKMKVNVDILTLTATPIPRTLYLSLMGGKDISMIETPPLARHPIETEIISYDKEIISNAIKLELERGGQVYYVHNRVETIDRVATEVRKMAPSAKILVGHGQMNPKSLEKTILSFMHGEVDILVCTTIIESGIDIPNANTMIVNNADKFGLADLYQLRGRIGRFDRQAYAYLVVRDMDILTTDVLERLSAIKKYQELGSGFKIAMRDLEMRGAGNILGVEQSGFIDLVGFDLYCRLLSGEIERQKKLLSMISKMD
ncbi:transcription-repair coupling factor [Candidatus Omnitrophus magneticus]|uniref:Transcription-repair-coupling factor n=1 Tax=Candidatus Omnitrophus magneticus TaxID=1609969 RepID=A0A0F0CQN9_9BACT|nr:transcription-repair coupling factor [Candidatus Omnitrophus magneticus]